jgi:hypothetical protein
MLLADILGHQLDDVFLDVIVLEVDRRQPILRAQKIGDLSVRDVAELGQRVAEVATALGLIRLGLFKLLETDELFSYEQLTEAVRRRIRHSGSLHGLRNE